MVNRERNRLRGINREKGSEEWGGSILSLLGIEGTVVHGGEVGRRVEERELERGEINRAIRKLKEGKAMGIELPGKVWKYGGKEVEDWVG